MKKWRIEYNQEFTETPLSFWVHKHLDHEVWCEAAVYDPALPKAIPGQGYPVLVVNIQGVELKFASPEEVTHFLSVIKQKNMPTTLQLSKQRISNHGPNSHWLSRLPAKLKPWSKRARMIPVLASALVDFEKVCT